MTMKTTQIDITPDKSLMPKISRTGYSLVQALSELVDNSIDARLDGGVLTIQIEVRPDHIQVLDNGTGMTERDASRSLKLGHSEKRGKLGEFGLGLKTACLSLGKRFRIYTTTRESAEKHILEFDEDEWMASSIVDWAHFPFKSISKKRPNSHGTTVKIEKLKVRTTGRTTDLRDSLAARFAPFLVSGEVDIELNGKSCRPVESVLTDEGKVRFHLVVDDQPIDGWYGLLREGSNRVLYGFSTFRRGRLITPYLKIGFEPHPTVSRIVGEVHMDHVPVTHNKREWITESSEFEAVEAALKLELRELVRRARSKATEDQLSPTVRDRTNSWMDNIGTALQLPEIRAYSRANVSIELATDMKSTNPEDPIKMMDEPTRLRRESSFERAGNPVDQTASNSGRNGEKPTHVLVIRGRRYSFSHEFRPLGSESDWKASSLDSKKGLEIFTNTDFPAFLTTTDKPYYAAYHVAESLAETMVRESNEPLENAEMIKQLILRKASQLMSQIA